MKNKVTEFLKKAPSTEARAEKFAQTISRNLQKSFLDVLIDKKEKMEDSLDSLLDFSLDTNLNKGVAPITREEAEKRIAKALDLKYELEMITLEINIKQKHFNEFFKELSTGEKEDVK